jgi:hypothetical protein
MVEKDSQKRSDERPGNGRGNRTTWSSAWDIKPTGGSKQAKLKRTYLEWYRNSKKDYIPIAGHATEVAEK